MYDREFLIWLHERMEHVHNESPIVDYMHKLRAIISRTPAKQMTPNVMGKNTLEDLKLDKNAVKVSKSSLNVLLTCLNDISNAIGDVLDHAELDPVNVAMLNKVIEKTDKIHSIFKAC